MSRAIHTIHWDDLGDLETARSLVVLPGPVDHDACLHEAGFRDFVDSDARWHTELEALASRIIDTLGSFGAPAVRAGERGASHLDRVIAAATSDQFPQYSVEFGQDAAASLCVGDGHPIFWLRLPADSSNLGAVLSAVSEGRLVRRTRLRWELLRPPGAQG